MGGLIFFYNEDGKIDTTKDFIECETDDDYLDAVYELKKRGYVQGVDFK